MLQNLYSYGLETWDVLKVRKATIPFGRQELLQPPSCQQYSGAAYKGAHGRAFANGECPKNRFLKSEDGEAGLNYLCKGYHHYFSHVSPFMDFMKRELMEQRPPANIMQHVRMENGKLHLF